MFLLKHVYAYLLACSSDERSLLAGSNNSVIKIYKFAGYNAIILSLYIVL